MWETSHVYAAVEEEQSGVWWLMNDRMQGENNENSVIYRIQQLRMKCWFFKPSFIYNNRHSS